VIKIVDEKLERFAQIGLLMVPGTMDVGKLDLQEDVPDSAP